MVTVYKIPGIDIEMHLHIKMNYFAKNMRLSGSHLLWSFDPLIIKDCLLKDWTNSFVKTFFCRKLYFACASLKVFMLLTIVVESRCSRKDVGHQGQSCKHLQPP